MTTDVIPRAKREARELAERRPQNRPMERRLSFGGTVRSLTRIQADPSVGRLQRKTAGYGDEQRRGARDGQAVRAASTWRRRTKRLTTSGRNVLTRALGRRRASSRPYSSATRLG